VPKKLPESPQIIVKEFTLEELDLGIEKLHRRIEDVQKLNAQKVSYDDAEIDNIENRIRETIREVFGPNSPEFQNHEYHHIWHGGYNMMDSDYTRQAKFTAGIPQTIKILEGLVAWLEEKRHDLVLSPVGKRIATFGDLNIHSRIAGVSHDLYSDGHYGNAVFDASKALINYVKERSGCYNLDGAPLMRKVFSRKNPILAFNTLKDQSDLDEQEGMMHLYEGAVLAIRNPRGHTFVDDSPERALQYIGLLSMLANRLEETNCIEQKQG